MLHNPGRWEHGSEFHWFSFEPLLEREFPSSSEGRFYGSGRDALRALISHCVASRNWRRMWLPSYFCQDVAKAILDTGIEVRVYPFGPEDLVPDFTLLDLREGDVVLRASLFGVSYLGPIAGLDRRMVDVVADWTHDPFNSRCLELDADWHFLSLRKSLPLPDGAYLWAPQRDVLPPEAKITKEREFASLKKVAAMLLKTSYLQGHAIEKEVFRKLATKGENGFARGPASGMTAWSKSLLDTFPVQLWQEVKRRNYRIFKARFGDMEGIQLWEPGIIHEWNPFSVILIFDTRKRRDVVRQRLISAGVYPAILWSLEKPCVSGVPLAHVDFSRRMLSVHCDMRYSEEDMIFVADMASRLGES